MLYEIVQTEDRGRAVRATTKIDPGTMGFEIFREDALMVLPLRGSEEDKSGPVPVILSKFDPQMWTDWWMFCQQTDEVKSKVLDLYRDMTCPHALCLEQYLKDKQSHRDEEKICDDDFDYGIFEKQDEFVDFAMVMRYNAVELQPPRADGTGPGEDFGSGLFDTACKINHSCTPNCAWYTSTDGRAKIIRAIAPIAKGEELTLNYMNNELEPITQRRDDLQKYKGFICDCPRCSTSKGDDTRRFTCATENCPGVHFLHQPMADTDPKLLPCTVCAATASSDYLEEVLKLESQVEAEVSTLERMPKEQRHEEAIERVMSLEPPHRLHALAERCFLMKAEGYIHQGKFLSAAECYARQLECRVAILGPHGESMTTAFTYELLGDILANVNLEKAEEAYKQTVRTLQFMRGGASDPYSHCAIKKLLDIQSLRVSMDSEKGDMALISRTDLAVDSALPDTEDTMKKLNGSIGDLRLIDGACDEDPCALCGNPSKLVSCSCGQVTYCCKDHVQLHWTMIHRMECEKCKKTPSTDDALMSSVKTGSLHTIPLASMP
mmetsp:Transcript_12141/g.35208  ORF Transcript_12141/g.35208 Transcript_12141/m.35208 type:complete len:550 (-) Transcript_12141:108-1757(-)|eukprot:CAMPEP_0119561630 /NCGR_PEP_ID=MMETSP1352-20130426/18196_1 /TAXON_ID=265584 /ORGANISM="Stauroneis constricta, Strain CCMP1120" /LENGTH=549 /DNA_ID=CAMNT_0007609877 /DNA_START=471 /DNA_END=2120 /DNA_ORIENTATION=+